MGDTALWDAILSLQRCRTDEDAWRRLHAAMWPFVYSWSLQFLKDHRAAEEAAVDTFSRIARLAKLGSISSEQQFRAYVKTTVRNVAIDRLRTTHPQPLDDNTPATSESPPSAASKEDLLHFLEGSVDRLDARMVRLLIAGYSYPEIGRELGLSIPAARMRVSRLRKILHKLLSEGDFRDP